MDKSFYVKNMFWGYFSAACILFFSYDSYETKMTYLKVFAILSALLFPFAKYLIEQISLKYLQRNVMRPGTFDVPDTYKFTLYCIFNFLFAIPLGIAFLVLQLKKAIIK
ncbi:colicin E1 family microcin immunity protein [Klebsiella oxytoca]|uniref:colicin E1 family microcin immunity protein n=1 Tax=Klebsiella TaxID=570 RepID=UPI000DF87DF5|nr:MULTISPECIES: colicin E1 family microcin immunity protein [Klebsiella]ELP2757493.1 hypothetical protein [Klebsiella oxytoca]MBK0167157.1 hypothetical protein [Klebsiella sp. S69]MEB7876039.1 hypothetical protein [Klebsiella oxytoca]STR22682.1 Colicin E1 (microcin) immunity protein [Klebsiella oxytoca]HBM3266245.1 hypothetical protein [Klebsiella oxytoca]